MGTPRRERAAAHRRAARPASACRDHADKYPSQMSGGMQQRLQIARCLAQEPAALMMDEPFGALDAMTRQALQDEMLDIARSTGATIFFVTHDLEEAIYLGDRVIGLHAASRPHRHRGRRSTCRARAIRSRRARARNFCACAANSTISSTRANATRGASAVKVAEGACAARRPDCARRDRRAGCGGPSDSIAPPSATLRAFGEALADGSLLVGDARHVDRALSAASRSALPSGLSLGIAARLVPRARPADGTADRSVAADPLGRGDPGRAGRARLRLSARNRHRRLSPASGRC